MNNEPAHHEQPRDATAGARRAGPVPPPGLPRAPIQRLMLPFARFFEIEATSGIILLLCTIAALLIANSDLSAEFLGFWNHEVGFAVGERTFKDTIGHWITAGLMTIFFFVVGLEIKREIVAGELRDPRKAALPVLGAIGGMLVPAGLYLAVHAIGGGGEWDGWGIPVATDIAFVVAIIAAFGARAPLGLRVFILSLAIADDVGAVIIIALFYSTQIHVAALGLAALGFGLVFALNRLGVRRVPVYVFVGAGIWLCFLCSGVHPTVAGVLLGLLTPASAWVGDRAFFEVVGGILHNLRSGTITSRRKRQESLRIITVAAHETISPLERLQVALHPWVAFAIIPLFALANVGVVIDATAARSPIVYAVALGLFLGKPLGIVGACYLAVKMRLAKLPTGVTWPAMLGAGWLCGIGFTMSLLIAGLSLEGRALEGGKIGVLAGSLASAIVGTLLLLIYLPRGIVAETISEVEAMEEEFDADLSAHAEANANATDAR